MMRFFALTAFLVLVGCPPAEKKAPPPTAGCSKMGQSCEYSPGKLGTCVQKDGCADTTKPDCFVCQSQH